MPGKAKKWESDEKKKKEKNVKAETMKEVRLVMWDSFFLCVLLSLVPFLSGYFRDDILCHFCASMFSGLVTTAASMPVDIVKTRCVSHTHKI